MPDLDTETLRADAKAALLRALGRWSEAKPLESFCDLDGDFGYEPEADKVILSLGWDGYLILPARLLAELDRYREALREIAGDGCYCCGPGWDNPRACVNTPKDRPDGWCMGCIAHAALLPKEAT